MNDQTKVVNQKREHDNDSSIDINDTWEAKNDSFNYKNDRKKTKITVEKPLTRVVIKQYEDD